jgi:hypothetical protein
MRKNVLLVFVVAALPLAACHRANFVYVALTGDNAKIVESGEPRIGFRRFGGNAIPIRYSVTEPGVSLTITVGNEAFVPSLVIVSSAPIRAVEVTSLGMAIPTNPPSEYKVFWSYWREGATPVRVGDPVHLRIELENRPEPVLVSGFVLESGFFYFSDI